MKCNTCKIEVSSRMKHAISKNICPACGDRIFSGIEFQFRNALSEIMEKNNVTYPEQANSIIDDIITFVEKKSGIISESEPLINSPESEIVSENALLTEEIRPEVQMNDEEREFIEQNPDIFAGSVGNSDEIAKKAERLKKKVVKGSGPTRIRRSGDS